MAHVALVFLLVVLTCARAGAQQTRADRIQAERTQKVDQLRPYDRSAIEEALFKIESDLLLERIFDPPRGVFARVGRLGEGSGPAAGPAFRLGSSAATLTLSSAVSTKTYWIVEANLELPYVANDRVFVAANVRLQERPEEDFYGLGGVPSESLRTTFMLRDWAANGLLGTRLTSWLSFAGTAEYLAPDVGTGKDNRFPSVDELFTPATVPGLGVPTNFGRFEGRLTMDYTQPTRTSRSGSAYMAYDRYGDLDFDRFLFRNARSGGTYIAAYHRYADLDRHRFSFNRWELDLQQYLPLLNRSRTIALRGFTSTSDARESNDVPFYLQRTLGGSHSLRGLRAQRLRGEHVLLLQGEYRWEVNAFVTGVMFYDTGKVTRRIRDLNFDDLSDDYGFGVRIGSREGVALRTEVAFGGRDGTRAFLRFGNVF